MKQFLTILAYSWSLFCFGQSIFSNAITGVNPNLSNPFTDGQVVDPAITVSGIERGTELFGLNSNDRYDAKSWGLLTFDPNAYFEFSITPNSGNKIDFVNFVYTGQISNNGPTLFAFRSSTDNFTSNIGVVNATGTTVSLADTNFQNITSVITFRLYGWKAAAGTGSFSVNNFRFNGVVSCTIPQAVVLPKTSISCKATSFELHWPTVLYADNYHIDVAKDPDFAEYITNFNDKNLGNVDIKTISGLPAGSTYYVRLRAENYCGISINSNTIEVSPVATAYHNGIWSNGFPDIDTNIQFLSDYNINGIIEACSCLIADGATVLVHSDATLKLENGLTIQSTGTLTFDNNASLVQVNDAAINTGYVTYNRSCTGLKPLDYVYWSSPLTAQTLENVLPQSDKSWNYIEGKWVAASGIMQAGEGGIVRYKNAISQNAKFVGVPNNGIYTIASQSSGSNLIGNPYPSALYANKFIDDNGATIGGSLYFWTHNTEIKINNNSTKHIYSANDYACYSKSGGVQATSQGLKPDGTIAAGQSFFVPKGSGGDFIFTNSMRIADPGANSSFYKPSNSKQEAKIEKNRVWLNLTNDDGVFKQLLVAYITGATNEYDYLYDGITFNGNTYADFYSIANAKKYAIQGRTLPFDVTDEVALGYKSNIVGTLQISIDMTDGVLANHFIYLEDKVIHTVFDLSQGAYSFSTTKGEFNDRFVLRYIEKEKLETINFDTRQKEVIVTVKNHQIQIHSLDQMISSIKVYDLKGSLVFEKEGISNSEFEISNLLSSNQFLIIRIQLENGKCMSEEIILSK